MKMQKNLSFLLCLFVLVFSFFACKPQKEIEEPQKKDPPSQAKTYYEYFDTVSAVFSLDIFHVFLIVFITQLIQHIP